MRQKFILLFAFISLHAASQYEKVYEFDRPVKPVSSTSAHCDEEGNTLILITSAKEWHVKYLDKNFHLISEHTSQKKYEINPTILGCTSKNGTFCFIGMIEDNGINKIYGYVIDAKNISNSRGLTFLAATNVILDIYEKDGSFYMITQESIPERRVEIKEYTGFQLTGKWEFLKGQKKELKDLGISDHLHIYTNKFIDFKRISNSHKCYHFGDKIYLAIDKKTHTKAYVFNLKDNTLDIKHYSTLEDPLSKRYRSTTYHTSSMIYDNHIFQITCNSYRGFLSVLNLDSGNTEKTFPFQKDSLIHFKNSELIQEDCTSSIFTGGIKKELKNTSVYLRKVNTYGPAIAVNFDKKNNYILQIGSITFVKSNFNYNNLQFKTPTFTPPKLNFGPNSSYDMPQLFPTGSGYVYVYFSSYIDGKTLDHIDGSLGGYKYRNYIAEYKEFFDIFKYYREFHSGTDLFYFGYVREKKMFEVYKMIDEDPLDERL